MNDLDILCQLRRKVGRDLRCECKGSCRRHFPDIRCLCFPGAYTSSYGVGKAEILSLIARLSSLRRLDLRRCMVFVTPDEMSNLVNLTYLDLGSALGEVPAWVGKIKDLHYLNLGVNRLRVARLPCQVCQFTNLHGAQERLARLRR